MNKSLHYAWVICIGCAILCALTSPIVNATATLYLKSVTADFGVNRSAFTLSTTIVALCGMFTSPFWGKIYSYKNKMRNVLTLTMLGFGLSYMSYSLAQNIVHFYISALVLGIFWAGACFMPISMMITAWFKQKRGLAMSITLAGIGFGGSILAPLVRYFIDVYGWRGAYQYVGIILIVIACPIIFFLLKPAPDAMGLKPYGEGEKEETSKVTIAAKKITEDDIDISPNESKTKLFFWLHMIGFFGMGLVCSAPMRQMNPYISDIYGATFAANVIALSSFMGVFGKLLLGYMHDKLGTMKSSAIAFGVFALAFIAAIAGKSMGQNLFYVYIILYSFAAGVGTVSAPLLISATFGTKSFNIMRGITQSPLQAGMSLGGLMVAAVFDITGTYSLGWSTCIIISVFSMVCFYIAHKMSRREYTDRIKIAAQC
ncbi:MAG: MFS transporter [Dehalobacterium sp.]